MQHVDSRELPPAQHGRNNVGLGAFAGADLDANRDNNIDIGNRGAQGESNTIRIGTKGTHKSTFIAGIAGSFVAGEPVAVDSNGHLGVFGFSSARVKTAIKPMDRASEAILALRPVTFRYKPELDPDGISQFGLIAEEVEKVSPDLVSRNADGRINTVRYEAVNAMLLNEFLKEHVKVQKLEATVTRQQKQIEELTAGLQKVSAQIELSRAAPQTVLNNQ